ncbi:aminomethyl-transferring glycine dehydrogenase subunit GcvPB, partial [bacterium]|nr:aminomethyl-transferring glycine dehydrogenase subunit GcvPB [bacterium]
MTERLIFEISSPGRRGFSFPALDVPETDSDDMIPAKFLRKECRLPSCSELDVVRHFTRLSRLNHGVDVGFYPLGSCTMKYNPKINEDIAGLSGFSRLHPYQPESMVQGALKLLSDLEYKISEITGMDAVTLQ